MHSCELYIIQNSKGICCSALCVLELDYTQWCRRGMGGGGGGGGNCPPLLDMLARLIFIYETTVKQMFATDCTRSCLRAQKYQKISRGMPPDPPRGVRNN